MTLTAAERRTRDRQQARVRRALLNPTRVTNPKAMLDAKIDAFGDWPTVGAVRRGLCVVHDQPLVPRFDWTAVRCQVDAEIAAQIADVLKPRQPEPQRRLRIVRINGNRDGRYGAVALEGEAARVRDAQVGERNNILASASFRVGQLHSAGQLDAGKAFAALLDAATKAGLPEREARPTIRSGMRAGCRKPRGAA